ncbi:MAG: stage II sporulation protein M [Thermaerobacter sp.]|nr:stage II sporulation protein M [Thermaerobacter sp.]
MEGGKVRLSRRSSGYLAYVLGVEAGFFLLVALFTVAYRHAPHLPVAQLRRDILAGPESGLLTSGNPLEVMVGIYLRNVTWLGVLTVLLYLATHLRRAVAQLLSLVLFAGAAVLLFVTNTVLGGMVLAAQSQAHHVAWWAIFAAGVLPHGVLEIFALAVPLAALPYLGALWGAGGGLLDSLPRVWRDAGPWPLRAFGVLALAAVTETFITPLLLSLVLPLPRHFLGGG